MSQKILALSFAIALVATEAHAATFLAGYVEDAEGVGIGDAIIVLDHAGAKMEELRTAPDGWFESGDLGRDTEPTNVHVAVLKEGFEFHRVMVPLQGSRSFVRLRLQMLPGAFLLEEELKGGGFLLVHGNVDNRGDQPIVGASVALRVGARQVGFAYSGTNGYFSIPVAWEHRDSPAEVRIDHPLHDGTTINIEKLAPNLPPASSLLDSSSGLRFFVSYPEVFGSSYSDFRLPNVVFGRNPGFTNVSARVGDRTLPAILEANSWQIELPNLDSEQARKLTFQFQLAVRDLPKPERERVMRRVRDVVAGLSGPAATQDEIRRQLDALLREELDNFLGVLDPGMREALDERRVSPRLATALQELGAAVPPGSLIDVAERARTWYIIGGEKNSLFIFEGEKGLPVFRSVDGTELRFSSVGQSPANEQVLGRLLRSSSGSDDPEAATMDLEVVQQVARRPPAADRQRFGLGLKYGMFYPSGESPHIASFGVGYEVVLSTFPLLRLRSDLERYGTKDWRSNLSVDIGAGLGVLQRSVSGGGSVSEKGLLLSLGAGYYLSDTLFLSLGAYRQETPSVEGFYLALGIGIHQF